MRYSRPIGNVACFVSGVVVCICFYWIVKSPERKIEQQSCKFHLFVNREFKPISLIYYCRDASGAVIHGINYSWRWKTGVGPALDMTKTVTTLGEESEVSVYFTDSISFKKMPVDLDGLVCISGTSNHNEFVVDIMK